MDVYFIGYKEEAKTLPFEQRIQTMTNQIGPRHHQVIWHAQGIKVDLITFYKNQQLTLKCTLYWC